MCDLHAGPAFFSDASGATDPYWSSVVLLVDASARSDGSTPSDIDVKGKTPTYVGGAQCDTSDYVFGSSSLYFDGSGDWMYFADAADFEMGAGDWTYEYWAKRDGAQTASAMIISQAAATGANYTVQSYSFYPTNRPYAFVGRGAGGTPDGYVGGQVSLTNEEFSSWAHIAIVRSGSTIYWFSRGVLGGSAAFTYTLFNASAPMVIGNELYNTSSYPWKGWIDQIRITKGVGRYTANFTPPAAPFPHS